MRGWQWFHYAKLAATLALFVGLPIVGAWLARRRKGGDS